MKIKRYKKVNKHLNFYVNNFNFRKPYQVLIDGTFCLAALKNKVNIADNLPRYLQDEIKLITTQCIIIEVEKLGTKLGGALHVLKQYTIHKCGHEGKPIPASKCLQTMVKNRNENHYFIATQDRELQDRIRNKISVPLIYLHGKTPILDEPSEKSLKLIKEKLRNLSSLELEKIEQLKHETGLDKVDEIKRPKRKRPKAPNPLSCKKKKKKTLEQQQSKKDTNRIEKKAKRKKIRIPQHVKEELLKKTHLI